MRTTLTLDDDLAAKLRARAAKLRVPLKQLVNDTLRTGLHVKTAAKPRRYKIKPHSFGLRPGIDPDKLNQLVDELEVEEFARKQNRSRK